MKLGRAIKHINYTSTSKTTPLSKTVTAMKRADNFLSGEVSGESLNPYKGMPRDSARELNLELLKLADKAKAEGKGRVGKGHRLSTAEVAESCERGALEAKNEASELRQKNSDTFSQGVFFSICGCAASVVFPPAGLLFCAVGLWGMTAGLSGADVKQLEKEASNLNEAATALKGWNGTLSNQEMFLAK